MIMCKEKFFFLEIFGGSVCIFYIQFIITVYFYSISAEMVKHYAKVKGVNTRPMDPSVPASNDAGFVPEENQNFAENNYESADTRSVRSKL